MRHASICAVLFLGEVEALLLYDSSNLTLPLLCHLFGCCDILYRCGVI
jgi:hypothetical protein